MQAAIFFCNLQNKKWKHINQILNKRFILWKIYDWSCCVKTTKDFTFIKCIFHPKFNMLANYLASFVYTFNFLLIKMQEMTFWRKISNRRVKVCPSPNIKYSNNEITCSSQLTIIWTRKTNRGKIENGIKCKTHIDKSKRKNKIRCSKHTNRSRIESGIRWRRHIDRGRINNKIKCKRNNINYRIMHKKINWKTRIQRNILLIKV